MQSAREQPGHSILLLLSDSFILKTGAMEQSIMWVRMEAAAIKDCSGLWDRIWTTIWLQHKVIKEN